jgi:GrpB-like predicted nucleotidyltransferase (UPF0157 family)
MTEGTSGPLGVAEGAVRLLDSDKRWPDLYRAEEARLRAALGPMALAIEHFGSTAIPGIKAKPILDILVGIARFEDGPRLIEPLAMLGYDYVGAEIVPDDHLFGLGQPRLHLLHAVEHGGYHWTRDLKFRDRLRADPALAAAYEQLKIELAERFADKRAEYTAAKQAFIDSIADG